MIQKPQQNVPLLHLHQVDSPRKQEMLVLRYTQASLQEQMLVFDQSILPRPLQHVALELVSKLARWSSPCACSGSRSAPHGYHPDTPSNPYSAASIQGCTPDECHHE